MPFLDLSSPTAAQGDFPSAPILQAGTHLVTLSSLKYVAKCDKALAEFVAENGDTHVEWMGAQSEGQKTRLKVFLGRLCALCSVSHALKFDSMAAFDQLGQALVNTKVPLRIVLHETTWQDRSRVEFDGFFDKCILPGVEVEEVF